MKHQILSILAVEAVLISVASLAIAQAITPVRRVTEIMNHRCNRATEVSYQSKQMRSPDESTLVHFEGTLRKLVNTTSNQEKRRPRCWGQAQTVKHQVVLAGKTGAIRLEETPFKDGYAIFEPLSFSPNGQYIAIRAEVAYGGLELQNYVYMLNAASGQVVQTTEICKSLAPREVNNEVYVGFTPTGALIVECQSIYEDPATAPARIESIAPHSGTIRQLSERPIDIASYGTTANIFEITQVQRF